MWQHIPNNPYYKIPGLPRGRRMIFVGIDSDFGGWKIFDPERRSYEHSGICILGRIFQVALML